MLPDISLKVYKINFSFLIFIQYIYYNTIKLYYIQSSTNYIIPISKFHESLNKFTTDIYVNKFLNIYLNEK